MSHFRSFFPALSAFLAIACLVTALPLIGAETNPGDTSASASTPVRKATLNNIGSRKPVPDLVPASDEPLRALARMKAPDGFEISLWAAEPMLAKPVAFNFDEQGRAFVVETHRYRTSVLDARQNLPFLEDDLAARTIEDRLGLIRKHFGTAGEKELGIESEIIRLLEDTDRDGVADKSSIYAEGFNSALDGIAAGVLIRRGEVWFTNIPSFWRFTGRDRAETRTELSRGYGVRFNYIGHDLHSPTWGPDGRIYFGIGDRGATVKTKEGNIIDAADTGSVFRCLPDGSQLELFATGLRNPQGLVFNEVGDLFTADNDSDNGDEERLVHVVDGGDSGWRVGYQYAPLGRAGPWNSEKLWHPRHAGQPAYFLPPIANVEDGPSGITYYPGTGFRSDYQGALFVTHYKGGSLANSGVLSYQLKPDGAGYDIADAKIFLAQALPTDVKFGPDGRFYFTDWADHHSGTKRGRVYAMADKTQTGSPLLRETQQLIAGDWTRRPLSELVQLLAHPDWRIRLEAQFELVARGTTSIAIVAQAARENSSPLARRHAVWALGQLAEKNPAALAPLRPLLAAPDSEIRAQTAKILGERRSATDTPALIAALEDKHPRVRFFAAQSLGKLKHSAAMSPELVERATPALLDALRTNNNRDHYLRHALVMGLAGANDIAALSAAASDKSPAIRLGALLALRRLHRPEVAVFLADSSPLIAREAALAINDAPIPAAYPALAALLNQPQPLTDEPVFLRAINAHFRLGQPANAAALAQHAARADAPIKSRAEALAQLALWPTPPQRDRIVGVYRPLDRSSDANAGTPRDRNVAARVLEPHLSTLLASSTPTAVLTATFHALQTLEIPGAADALFAAVRDDEQPAATRAAALVTLEKIKDPRLAEAIGLAGASSASTLRLAALPIAARLSPDIAAPVLANLVAKGTPAEQRVAFGALSTLEHPIAVELFAAQLRALAAGKVDPIVQLDLLNATRRRTEPSIISLLAARDVSLAANPDPLAPFRVALAGGDRRRGESVFRSHPTLACLQCHRAGRDGGDAGPDLAGIGSKQTREYLLEAIIKPNATIAPGFDSVVLTLKDGTTAVGIVTRETPSTLTLRLADNQVRDIAEADIARRDGAPSAMPEIYGTLLTKSELRDIIEFIATVKAENPDRLASALPRALRTAGPTAAPKKRKRK